MIAERLPLRPAPPRPFVAGPRLSLVARSQPWMHSTPTAETLGVMLLREGLVAPDDIVQALALHARQRGRLADILLARGMIDETRLFSALAMDTAVVSRLSIWAAMSRSALTLAPVVDCIARI